MNICPSCLQSCPITAIYCIHCGNSFEWGLGPELTNTATTAAGTAGNYCQTCGQSLKQQQQQQQHQQQSQPHLQSINPAAILVKGELQPISTAVPAPAPIPVTAAATATATVPVPVPVPVPAQIQAQAPSQPQPQLQPQLQPQMPAQQDKNQSQQQSQPQPQQQQQQSHAPAKKPAAAALLTVKPKSAELNPFNQPSLALAESLKLKQKQKQFKPLAVSVSVPVPTANPESALELGLEPESINTVSTSVSAFLNKRQRINPKLADSNTNILTVNVKPITAEKPIENFKPITIPAAAAAAAAGSTENIEIVSIDYSAQTDELESWYNENQSAILANNLELVELLDPFIDQIEEIRSTTAIPYSIKKRLDSLYELVLVLKDQSIINNQSIINTAALAAAAETGQGTGTGIESNSTAVRTGNSFGYY